MNRDIHLHLCIVNEYCNTYTSVNRDISIMMHLHLWTDIYISLCTGIWVIWFCYICEQIYEYNTFKIVNRTECYTFTSVSRTTQYFYTCEQRYEYRNILTSVNVYMRNETVLHRVGNISDACSWKACKICGCSIINSIW